MWFSWTETVCDIMSPASCRKWIITQITFVIHLIFMAFMNCVKCVSSNVMLEKMICHNFNLLNFHLLWSQLSWVYFLLWKWLSCHIYLQIKYSTHIKIFIILITLIFQNNFLNKFCGIFPIFFGGVATFAVEVWSWKLFQI